jgi:hypothetical protein
MRFSSAAVNFRFAFFLERAEFERAFVAADLLLVADECEAVFAVDVWAWARESEDRRSKKTQGDSLDRILTSSV